jgi:hypothetical protein
MTIRYLRHYYVDGADKNKFLIDSNTGVNGKTHPVIRSLDVKYWTTDSAGIDYCLSIVDDDDAIIPMSNGIEILTFENWANRVEILFNRLIEDSQLQNQNFTLDKTNLDSLQSSFAIVHTYLQEQLETPQ